jgi:hypothetical protein
MADVTNSISDAEKSRAIESLRRLQHDATGEVYGTIRASFIQRFPAVAIASEFLLDTSRIDRLPSNILTCAHMACTPVVVHDRATRNACLTFIASSSTIALRTETRPFTDNDDNVDLIQLGTTAVVYLISPAMESAAFIKALRAALTGKTVLHWTSNGLAKLVSCVGDVSTVTSVDVQLLSDGYELAQCAGRFTQSYYTLCTTWACSGWDVRPLTPGQIEYATLTVALMYGMWLSKREPHPFSVWHAQSPVHAKVPRYHSFRWPPDQPSPQATEADVDLHGIAYTEGALGHYDRNGRTRGFYVDVSGSIVPRGFVEPPEMSTGNASGSWDVAAQRFMRMLLDRSICCSACSHIINHHAPESFFRCPVGHQRSQQTIPRTTTPADVARYCLAQLGGVLRLPIRYRSLTSDQVRAMIQSVHHDILYGYIDTTLTWF